MSKLELIRKDLLVLLNSTKEKNIIKRILELIEYIDNVQRECLELLVAKETPQVVQPPFSWQILQSESSPFKT